MSKCDIKIEVDKTTYKIGDTVRGVVVVNVDKECKCDALQLKKYWSTHGKGNRDSGRAESLTLFKGVWQAGSYRYPFKFVLHEGPLSYHGHYINIDWYLAAKADIPWAFDPQDKQEFIVEKSDEEDRYAADIYAAKATDSDQSGSDQSSIKLSPYVIMIFPLLFVAAGLAILWFEQAVFIGGMFVFAGSFMAYKIIQSALAEKKLGEVKCEVNSKVLKAGDKLRCSVSFMPQSKVNINCIAITLSVNEKSISGSGTNKKTYYHCLFKDEQTFLRNTKFEKGGYAGDNAIFELPVDAVASFTASNNSIDWDVNIRIDIARWPDWSEVISLEVLSG